jgi:quinol monooxygenase YgiN
MAEKMILQFSADPEKRAEFVELCIGVCPDTRAYDGNLSTLIWVPEDDESIVWIYEEWETRAHQEAYFNWRVETGLIEAVSSFLTAPPRVIWLSEK